MGRRGREKERMRGKERERENRREKEGKHFDSSPRKLKGEMMTKL